jgi:hypothetical protein
MYNDPYSPNNQQPDDTTQQGFYPPSNIHPQDPYQSNSNYPYGSYPPPSPHQPGSNYQYGSYPPLPPPTPGQFVYSPQSPSPHPMKPYSNNIFFILAATCFISILLIFLGNNTTSDSDPIAHFGAGLFSAVLVSVLIIDWHGFTTLQGWIHWKQVTQKQRFWLWCLYLFLFEIVLVIYFIRTALVVFSLLPTGVVKPSTRSRVSVGFTVGTCMALIGLMSATTAPTVTSTTSSSQIAQNVVLTSASPTLIPTRVATKLTATPISTPAPEPTTAPAALPTQAPAPKPTQAPVPKPTTAPIVSPTQAPAPKPTQAPAPAQPPAPKPTQPPAPAQTGINGNPWGYNFNSGNLIYSPPANFCDYFNCIKSFWLSTNGYVDECNDGTYSHSGGRRGACSYHGGEMRPLYSH